MQHQLQQHIEHQKRIAMMEGTGAEMMSPTGQPLAPTSGGPMMRPPQPGGNAGVYEIICRIIFC